MDFTVSIDLEKVVVETDNDNDNSPDDEFGPRAGFVPQPDKAKPVVLPPKVDKGKQVIGTMPKKLLIFLLQRCQAILTLLMFVTTVAKVEALVLAASNGLLAKRSLLVVCLCQRPKNGSKCDVFAWRVS
ncbi:hypothetical protein FCV25MIE_04045 [Fagus crenata]